MANAPEFHDTKEPHDARGGKRTAIATLTIAAVVIAGGITLAMALRHVVSPPMRPGTTNGTTTAGEQKPPPSP